jgi:leucyl aminopeptidase
MDLYIKNIGETKCACNALILPFTEGDAGLYDGLGRSSQSIIRRVFSREFKGRANEILLIPSPEDTRPERFLLVGLGKAEKVSAEVLRQAGGKAAAYLRDMGMKRVALSTAVISSLRLSPVDFIEGALLGLYTYRKYSKEKNKKGMEGITILARSSKGLSRQLAWAKTVASAVCFARDLVNTPSNDMTPSHLAKAAFSLKQKNLSVNVLEGKDARRLGMGCYLSVAKGSDEPPKFIILEYKGAADAPLVLVGKSVTFDSGGLSLKPSEGMEKMKYDMAGGAAVLGAVKIAAEFKLPVRLVGILPAAENLPGGSAAKPGDIVRAINGLTVEIVNTDAEGRLTLADAIAYAKRLKPRAIIDIATLTGACSIALGSEAIAMMGNDRALLEEVKESAEHTFERVWEMPLFEDYKDYIKSDVADIKNTGGRTGSLLASAYFLSEFAGKVPWVHLDIAGTAWTEKDRPYTPKGASGIGVRLLSNLLKEMK